MIVTMPRTVGVAPGTTTFRLNGLGEIDTRAHVRWDLIALVGGGSLIIALGAALLASALIPATR